MAKALVIVESPAKCKTIEKFLGKGYTVKASYGHVRALPSKQGSVDIANDFEPLYKNLPDSQKHLTALKKDLKGCDELILATDPDREGEAIAWHLLKALKIDENGDKPKVKRVVFHEITAGAIKEAMANPRQISKEMVDAQQARSILDYLVGFNLSPFLWKKIRYGLSAGRVQSVALRVICEREKDIKAFNSDEYWTIGADMISAAGKGFSARLHSKNGKKIGKLDIGNQAAADEIVAALKDADMTISAVTKKQKKRNPAAPFTTSTLQQEANRKLGFSARKTMSVAQKLYEGIDIGDGDVGLITYMRTDSVALSTVATDEAREVIGARYGKEYALDKPRTFKNKSKNAQEAHEAVRPTSIGNIPQEIKAHLSSDQYKLYNLIWTRTIASQMAVAILDATSVDITAADTFIFRASGQVIRFPGFMKVYIEGTDNGGDNENEEGLLPDLKKYEKVECKELLPEQHFTQPPPRFTEASLVKILEEYGIGRPSTYASIMNTLVTRKYVILEKRAFFPEDVGMIVSDLLTTHFTKYVDYDFTAKMEEDLDAISRGESQWKPLLTEFWEPFHTLLQQKEKEVSKGDITTEEIDQDCPECSKKLAIKLGRRGKFIACTGFPDCRYTAALSGDNQPEEPVVSDQKCEKCGEPMLIKDGRYGKFYACSGYPECKNIQPLEKPKSTGVVCPECKEGEIQEKKSRYGKIFYSCNRYPKCKYALWNPPIEDPCPDCGHVLTTRKTTKRKGTMRVCPIKECGFEEPIIEAEEEKSE
jgi:DNA topoisomerase-1